jgi:hypothetical protein
MSRKCRHFRKKYISMNLFDSPEEWFALCFSYISAFLVVLPIKDMVFILFVYGYKNNGIVGLYRNYLGKLMLELFTVRYMYV